MINANKLLWTWQTPVWYSKVTSCLMKTTIDVVFDADKHDRSVSLHMIDPNAKNFLYRSHSPFVPNEWNNDLSWDYVEWNSRWNESNDAGNEKQLIIIAVLVLANRDDSCHNKDIALRYNYKFGWESSVDRAMKESLERLIAHRNREVLDSF